jgi:hypothetical protein
MSFSWPYPEQEHVLRVVIYDEQALAYSWIEAYAANLSDAPDDPYFEGFVTAEELIDTALDNIDCTKYYHHHEYITKGGLLEGVSVEDMFWDKLAIFQGIEIPENKRDNFFSCSC